ncbi:hypothetical protein PL8927_840004 [Planktothrix serta PCC 8927]|uniref:Uncharacterized protein n=1 Tax=Planktothrix serta PCC 8927 TaxID=671068 RepID=A0A7Z9E3K8_9CYAN|nr:hypothetical protein [Planktothrix serta]VXD25182.1 hypothetical protein PL8927_840004 [Planktothrix serta PCC 8927]
MAKNSAAEGQRAMKYLYTLLLALSLILINPWGDNRGEIWTYSKVGYFQLCLVLKFSNITEFTGKN